MLYVPLPLKYVEPIYRPPSEARSLIFQVTIGCSNLAVRPDDASPTGYRVARGCAFCVAYQAKPFRARPRADVLDEIDRVAAVVPSTRRVFLADGDAVVLKTERLVEILERLRVRFPRLERVTAYASPRNLLKKSVDDLRALRDAGLAMVYVGIESGDDEVLRLVDKRSTADEMIEGCLKAKEAGIALSLTVILGLGGPARSRQHARETARVLNAIGPEYAAALTLMIEPRVPMFQEVVGDPDFRELSVAETLSECRELIACLETEGTEFRSNHASNWLALKGRLTADKTRLLATTPTRRCFARNTGGRCSEPTVAAHKRRSRSVPRVESFVGSTPASATVSPATVIATEGATRCCTTAAPSRRCSPGRTRPGC
jgi:hypothetical protein